MKWKLIIGLIIGGIIMVNLVSAFNHYTGDYRVLSKTGAESIYDITFEKVLVEYDEESNLWEKILDFFNLKDIKSYEVESTQICMEGEYVEDPPSTLSLYKEGVKDNDLSLDNSSNIGGKYQVKFCYTANPVEDFYLQFGDSSIEIIQISSAEHLDSDYSFIKDVYNETINLDTNWTNPIYHNQYIRITFEQNLTDENDITFWVRNNQSLNTSVEVYYFNTSNLITTSTIITDEGSYRILLTSLIGIEDTFDLKIVNQENNTSAYLEFDYIVDPVGYVSTLTNDDGDSLSSYKVDEFYPGDAVYEHTGKSSDPTNPAWIQCGFSGWRKIGSFDVSNYSTTPYGITTVDGTEFWLTDGGTDKVNHVNSTGGLIEQFDMISTGGYGITTVDGSEFWIAEQDDNEIYHVNSTGGAIDSFDTEILGATEPKGITTVNGSEFWFTDNDEDEVYHVNSTGGLIDSFDTEIFGSETPRGIATVDGSEFWIVDPFDYLVYRVNSTGGLIEAIDIKGFDSSFTHGGITTVDGTEFWTANDGDNGVYQFEPIAPPNATTQNITFYWGHYDEKNWALTTQDNYTGLVWSPDGTSTFYNITDYNVSTIDIDENYTMTTNLPTAQQLNDGIYLRFIGYDTNAGAEDDLFLDYCYYEVEYTTAIDTCSCPGLNQNWEVDMSDYCQLGDCELGTGTLNWTGSGWANCTGNINTTNMGEPVTNQTLYIPQPCLINIGI